MFNNLPKTMGFLSSRAKDHIRVLLLPQETVTQKENLSWSRRRDSPELDEIVFSPHL